MTRFRQFFFMAALILLAAGSQPAIGAFWQWSKTADTNATADPTINWSEGMSPSSVNDSARAMMARAAEYRDDISGSVSTAGSSSAYTLATNQATGGNAIASPPSDGQMLALRAHTTNAVNATLQVDGGTAYPLQTASGSAVGAGVIVSGTPYRISFNNSALAWVLEGGQGNPYNIPLGGYLFTSVTSAPNSNFVAANAGCISRTTYAAYFALVSTTYGACDGTTTFGVPDMRGRVPTMLDGGANRLTSTSTGCGTAFTSLGVTCATGTESKTLITANLPPYTPAGSVATTNANNSTSNFNGSAASGGGQVTGNGLVNINPSSTFTGTAQGGISTPLSSIQPNYGVNVFVRVF